VIRQEAVDLAEDGADYNVLKHNPPVNAGDRAGSAPTFVNPNLDVVYSEAWIAVDAATPTILEIPEVPAGLYYTAQIVDEWAEITHNINERNNPDHPFGRFAICVVGSTPTIPPDCARVDIPSTKAKLLTRVELADDIDGAVRLQHGFTVTSTGDPDITPLVEFPPFTNAALPGVAVFQQPQLDGALAAAEVVAVPQRLTVGRVARSPLTGIIRTTQRTIGRPSARAQRILTLGAPPQLG
jgi:hypothetical protein